MTLSYRDYPEAEGDSRPGTPSSFPDHSSEGPHANFLSSDTPNEETGSDSRDDSTGPSSKTRWSEKVRRGATTAGKGLAVGVGSIVAGAVYVAMTPVGFISTSFLQASESVLDWARRAEFGSGESEGKKARNPEQAKDIGKERDREGFEKEFRHVAVCGPAGSGKSSIINALMGLRNKDDGAANTGFVETTERQEKYPAHPSFGRIMLHDCPGAGTIRCPAENYSKTQKLHLFDMVLIVHGDRSGEIEVATMRFCIARQLPCVVLRSRSDEFINRIKRDDDVETCEAKDMYVKDSLEAFKDELRRALLSEKDLDQVANRYMLVNNHDLRGLTIKPRNQWPTHKGEIEIDERNLIEFLRHLGGRAA
ncbi:interferon-inducible GTPase [Durotheca rogersii]|uniref:interferon-inducible GTPase n=1 Tax=Durotheca rogersii TaxID=419775 RepID=UPI0022204A37|nr:interferon-inducible GTPase [Durotheca rogersii]KAI5864703.1 interferon-inducible GTPase [Durotheca rogersii]